MVDTSTNGLMLLLGPANSGKLGRVLHWWEERRARQPLIVVPTVPDARGLSAEMAQRQGALVGQAPATTFDGLVRALLGRSPTYAGEFERSLLVGHLLREEPPTAAGFSARSPGVVRVTAALLEQLGDSGLDPEDLVGLLARWEVADADSAALAADLRRLLARYRLLRDRLGLADRSDALRESLAVAGDWTRPLALYGFTSFTPAQRRLVETLSRTAEVLVAFDHEHSRGSSLTTPEELAWWEGLAACVERSKPRALAYTSPAIAYLERHFMDHQPPVGPPPAWSDTEGGVQFLLASGQRNEAELAAERVADLVRSGLLPGEIAVVVRSTKTWGRLLHDTFRSCGIPCEVDQRALLEETGLGHAFLSGLRGYAADDAVAVLRYLRSPFSPLTPGQAADVELDYLRGTARGVEALRGRVESSYGSALLFVKEAVAWSAGVAFIDPKAAQRLNRHMLQTVLSGFVADGEPERAAEIAEQAAEDARAFRALSEALENLALYRREGGLPTGVLSADVLLPALGSLAVAGGPTGSPGAVQVLTAHRARARRFQAVIVLGLVEGEFPGYADRPALLTAAQRGRLDTMGGGGLLPRETDEDEPLFVRAVSRAWKFLLLSARDADDGGGFAGQSYYWSHCKALLAVDDQEVRRRTLAEQVFGLQQAPSPRQYLRACAASRLAPHQACPGGRALPPPWTRAGGAAGLSSPRVLAELSAISCFTPSALESYLRCPFAWFVERVVGAEEMETAADDRLVGELLHLVLRDTFRQLDRVGALPLRSEHLELANRTAAAIIAGSIAEQDCPGTVAERRIVEWRLKSLVAEVLSMEATAGSLLQTFETECEVGGEAGVDVGGLALKGRIDRIDRGPAGELFIVDYKSGTAPARGKIGTEEALQLPLYMLALAAERPGVAVVGGAYLSPKDKKRSGLVEAGSEGLIGAGDGGCRAVGRDDLRELLDGSLDLAKRAAEGIRNGAVAPLPGRDCPAWCRLGPVCRARRGGRRW